MAAPSPIQCFDGVVESSEGRLNDVSAITLVTSSSVPPFGGNWLRDESLYQALAIAHGPPIVRGEYRRSSLSGRFERSQSQNIPKSLRSRAGSEDRCQDHRGGQTVEVRRGRKRI